MKKLLLNIGLAIAIITQAHTASALYSYSPTHQIQSEKLWAVLKQPKTLIGVAAASGTIFISIAIYQFIKSLNAKSKETITNLNQLLNYKNFTSQEGQKALEIFFETTTRGIIKGLQTIPSSNTPTKPNQPAYVDLLDHLAKTPAHQHLIIDTIQKLLTGILPLLLPQAQPGAAALPATADITTLQAQPLHNFVTFLTQTPQAADFCVKLVSAASHNLGYGYAIADSRAQSSAAPASENAVSKFFTFLKDNPILAAQLARSLAAGYAKGDALSTQLPSTTGASTPTPTLNNPQKHYAITQWFINILRRKKQ